MACTYKVLDVDGKPITLKGEAAFKAYLADGNLPRLIGKKGVLASKGEALSNPHTPDTLRAALASAFSPKFIEKLEGTGRFKVSTNEDVKGIIGDVTQFSKDGRPLAFYDRDTGITHILAENIPKTFTERQIKGLLSHEIGEHALQLGKTDKEYQSIQRDFDLLLKAGNKDAIEADRRAREADTPAEDMERERMGYLVEAAPESSIAQRFMTWFKGMVNKVLGPARLNWAYTEKDMAAMAQSALRRAPELLGKEAQKGGGALGSEARKEWYRSQLSDAISSVPAKVDNTSGNNWATWLTSNAAKLGVKKEEIEWSGINDYLKMRGKDKVSAAEVRDFLANNGVKVQDVVLGAKIEKIEKTHPSPMGMETSYTKQLGFTLTDAMREQAAKGLPLFSKDNISPALDRFIRARNKFAQILDNVNVEHYLRDMSPRSSIDDADSIMHAMGDTRDKITKSAARAAYTEMDNAYGALSRTNPELVDVFPKKPLPEIKETLRGEAVEARRDEDGKWYKVDKYGEWGTVPYDTEAEAMRKNPLFSKAPKEETPAKTAPPKESRFRAIQRTIQDNLNRFTVIKEWLADQGVHLSEAADVYKAEERMHSKFANKAEDFRNKIIEPLVRKIQKAGFTMDDVAQFLHAQHAEERNNQIAKINPNKPDGGSGMTTSEAKDILSKAKPELVKLANELRSITDKSKELLLTNGIINQELSDAWDATYQHYVPLKGGPEDTTSTGTGKGLKVTRTLKRALGHDMREGGEWIVENIFADYERALMLVEKNRVGQSLLKMLIEIGRDDIGTIGKPEKRGVLKDHKAYEVLANGEVIGVFQTLEAARAFKATAPALYKTKTPSAFMIRTSNDPAVAYMASPMLAENEVNVYVNGYAIRIQINDDLLARAYGNMGAEALNTILKAGRALNTFLSKIYTGYNPEFIQVNIVRDFSTGLINITGEAGALLAAKSAFNYPTMFGQLLKYSLTGKETKWITDYRADGGNTGAAYLSDLERLGSDIKTEYATYKGVMSNLNDKDYANAARAAGRNTFNVTLKWIEHLNQAGENAMRLAIYKAAVESGKSRNKASSLAKNSTVNFNRKGEMGAQANALYLFFNAGVQGTASLAHAHFKGEHKYQAWGLSTAMASLGYLIASSLGGGDEDEYDKLSDYTKSRNMVVKAGDGWVKIPIPYGYGFFWNTGRAMADAARKDKWGKTPWHIASSFVEEFTPFGAAVAGGKIDSVQMEYLAPTAWTMVRAPAINRTSMGGPVMPEGGFDKSQPDRDKMWRSTKGTMYDSLAGALEKVGADVSPETLKHYTRSLTGGAGALVDTSISSAMLKAQGADLEVKEMPFVRKFYGETSISDSRRAYYEVRDEAKSALEELNRAKKARDMGKAGDIIKEKSELIALAKYSSHLSKTITAARDRQDAVRLSDMPVAEKRLKLKEMEAAEEKIYDRYLEVFKEKTRGVSK